MIEMTILKQKLIEFRRRVELEIGFMNEEDEQKFFELFDRYFGEDTKWEEH